MSSLRIRLRLPSKQETLTLPTPVTIRALLEGIQSFIGGDLDRIEIRFGYPPKQANLSNTAEWDKDVSTIGIKNGETLIVTTSLEQPKETGHDMPSSHPVDPAPSIVPPKRDFAAFQDTSTKVSDTLSSQTEVPLSKKRVGPSAQDEPPEIPVDAGTVVLRIMADDNSCMYVHS